MRLRLSSKLVRFLHPRGDHSITAPAVAAFADQGPVHVIQFDAHLDFVDVRHGVRFGHGNCMRRCSEMNHVVGMTQLGIRNVSSTAKDGFDDARARGSDILSVRQIREMGLKSTLERLPSDDDARFYVTIDIVDSIPRLLLVLEPHGGFLYYEVQELLEGIAGRGEVVGVDVLR